ncbi:MAG TPA: alpha/beta fold hydrolase [Candidatus Acidoferrum sp.]|jgi:pimeloyl-ACP methyl ester carboxylesterase|nr:alpha/beta fold hydrolase [Candidatus Acidoferrum sp.]
MDFDSDGVRLHFELHGPEAGVPIVLVHGFASDYQLNWVGTRWQETLTTAGFRVIGLDCRGHGSSDKPHDPAAYALEIMAADVGRLLDHLEIEIANYLGYSMGGKIGVQAMLDFPQRLDRVVLGGVGWGGAFRAATQIAKAMRGGPFESPVAETFYNFAKARPSNDLEALAACILGPQPQPDTAALAAIKNPVLVVVGAQDDIAYGVDRLVESIPTAKLITIAGRNHMSAVPAGDFKKAAVDFLDAN